MKRDFYFVHGRRVNEILKHTPEGVSLISYQERLINYMWWTQVLCLYLIYYECVWITD